MRALSLVAFVATLAAAALATADQCQLVEPDVAQVALAAIRASHGRVLAHCEPCGDADPALSAAFVPRAVSSTGSSVIVDGTERDLAYLYLEVAPNVFENIALRTGCPASGIPQVWDFRSGTAARRGFGPVSSSMAALGWGPAHRRAPLPPPG